MCVCVCERIVSRRSPVARRTRIILCLFICFFFCRGLKRWRQRTMIIEIYACMLYVQCTHMRVAAFSQRDQKHPAHTHTHTFTDLHKRARERDRGIILYNIIKYG